MKTRVIVVGSLCAFGFAGWLALGGGGSSSAANVPAASAATPVAALPARAPSRGWLFGGGGAPVAKPAAEQDAPPKLDPKSDRFRNRVDEQIPSRLYGEA